ncbi:MAG: MATE family efflux transporter [Ignavibacterium sp.]|jgi:putative MATE family efflux protein|nr:MATE family efflux transporter [Ignavibacterium sp.]MDX9711952.1 MATE family efflux transporter [Ignavibacteriaceae bacterium]MEB2355405.1 MATE family efflux transporter [Ignavibacteriales bacterium]GIK23127.1 MAG: MATE family efflux transporter [Ignavibacteriota bacterium]HMN16355.1 MATE family efflux transporter [Ignavibacteriaceae bacterium]
MNLLPVNNYYKKILQVSLPAIAGLSTQMVVSLVDSAMVGRLEETTYALAAMGIGVLATWALVSFFSSLATGTHVIVARRFGQTNYLECGNTLNNSLIISFTIGIVVALIGVFFASSIANFFASDDQVAKYASEYLLFRFLGIPFFLISVSFRGFFFGISKTKIFMISGIFTNFFNIIFNYIFIYGEFGMPRMGLAGAGLGSTLATFIDVLFYLIIILLPAYRKRYQNFKFFKVDTEIIKGIFKISLPVSFQNVFVLIGFLSFVSITGIIGTKQQAATQAIISTLFISFLPLFGFGAAVQTLVGNNLGAKKFHLAKLYGFETVKVATIFTIIIGVVFISIPQYVLLIITNDWGIIEMAKPALRIAGITQIFYATGVVLANALQAAGRTVFVMIAEMVTNLLIFVPLAYFLGVVLDLGLTGAWMALPGYIIIYSIAVFIRFNSKNWNTNIPINLEN